jgi:hypothetical protein
MVAMKKTAYLKVKRFNWIEFIRDSTALLKARRLKLKMSLSGLSGVSISMHRRHGEFAATAQENSLSSPTPFRLRLERSHCIGVNIAGISLANWLDSQVIES